MNTTCQQNITVIDNNSKFEQILNRDYLGQRSHYVEVGSEKVILPGKFENYYRQIKEFEVRDDDVFVLAFQKTGSRWVQEMAWLLLNNLDFEKALQVKLYVRSPLLELETIVDKLSTEYTHFHDIPQLTSPRCIKSHLHWSLLPNDIVTGIKKPMIIVVLRGPEDTCTSYYHQSRATDGYSGTWENFCELFLAGKVPFEPYWKHVLGLWEQRQHENIMFVKYGELKSDLAGTIRKVASFLGKDLSNDEVTLMCEHLSFDNLKNSKGYNMSEMFKEGEVNPFVRTGKVGDHKVMISPGLIKAFKRQREELLIGTGLDLD